MKKSTKVVINNREWFAMSLTVGELLHAIDRIPTELLKKIVHDAGPNFDLNIMYIDKIPPDLRVILDNAGALDDDEVKEDQNEVNDATAPIKN